MKSLHILLSTSILVVASTGLAQSQSDPDLQAMEARLSILRQRFTDQHPEVVALLKRIEAHKSPSAPDSAPNPGTLSELQSARVRLAELRRTRTDKHPDVQTQIKLIEQLEQEKGK